jgi:hypothetical protein
MIIGEPHIRRPVAQRAFIPANMNERREEKIFPFVKVLLK